ncbi:hypothetical protein VTO73DRAFT_11997 [Trametes versicolor]
MSSTAAYNLQVDCLIHLEMLSVTSEYYATANASESFNMHVHRRGLSDNTVTYKVLVIWNHLLTFDSEFEFFWCRKITSPSALFLTIRYLTLCWAIYDTSWFYGISTNTATMYALYFLEASQYVAWGAFSSLRVYALWKRWAWAALVLLLSVAPPISSGVQLLFANVFAGTSSYATCSPTEVTMSDQLFISRQRSVGVVSRVSLIMADIIVLGVTWAATHEAHRSQNVLRGFGRTRTLSNVLYTNGAIYFVVLTTLNALYLAVILLEESLGSGVSGRMNLLAVFVKTTYDSFTTILVTRFLVHLKEAARPAMCSAFSFGSGVWTELGGPAGAAETGTLQWAQAGGDEDC